MLYFTVLRTSIAERLVYRVDFALGTLMRFLPIVTQIFLWQRRLLTAWAQRQGHDRRLQLWTT